MSYEGHTQGLCRNGHPTSFPCYYDIDYEQSQMRNWRCEARTNNVVCGEPLGETNSVDDTNGESYGERLLVEISPAEVHTCDLGHQHDWTSARYRFSEERYYSESGKLVPLSSWAHRLARRPLRENPLE